MVKKMHNELTVQLQKENIQIYTLPTHFLFRQNKIPCDKFSVCVCVCESMSMHSVTEKTIYMSRWGVGNDELLPNSCIHNSCSQSLAQLIYT